MPIKPRRRILHIMKMTGISGAEKHLLALLRGLAGQFDFTLLILVENDSPPFLPPYIEALQQAGVKVELQRLKGHFSPSLIWKLSRFLAQRDFALIHTHLFHADLYGTAAALLAGCKIRVSTKHNTNPFRRQFFYALLDRTAAAYQQRIIAISAAVKDYFIREEKLPSRKLQVIHYGLNPVDYSQINPLTRSGWEISSEAIVLGIVARLTRQKGHVYLLQAFQILLSQYPQLWLVIVGGGELAAELQAQALELGIQTRVKFVGAQSDPRPCYQAFDIFVHPSLWEGFGLVFLEAMAYKLPIVATEVDAIAEIVLTKETGLLVPPANVPALVEALSTLIDSPQIRQRLGNAGYQRLLEHFSEAQMCQRTAALYNSLLVD